MIFSLDKITYEWFARVKIHLSRIVHLHYNSYSDKVMYGTSTMGFNVFYIVLV